MAGIIGTFFLLLIIYFFIKILKLVSGPQTNYSEQTYLELKRLAKAMEEIASHLPQQPEAAPTPSEETWHGRRRHRRVSSEAAMAAPTVETAVLAPPKAEEAAAPTPQMAEAAALASPKAEEAAAPTVQMAEGVALAPPKAEEAAVVSPPPPQMVEAAAPAAPQAEEAVAPAPPNGDLQASPREPTAFERRLVALRNWFIYGNAAGATGDSVEKMVATTWLLRAGILVILVTTGFLLKLSIERGLLGPEGRVALSYLCGAALLYGGLHRRMRCTYWTLGQALAGIGLGMFYFSSYAMVSLHHLTPPMVGGFVMVLVTLTAGVLADRLLSLPIAMVSMLGGFATPWMLNTGAKNFPGLAAYLLLLGAGVLWLANRRNWQQLTWLAMLFTYGLYGAAYKAHFAPQEDLAVYQTALLLFFILFSTSVFIHNIRLKLAAGALEILGLLGNSLIFFSMSATAILRTMGHDRLALAPLTIGLALYYLGHAVFLQRRNETAHRNLLLIFCALSGFYLCLTFPAILTGQWLAPAWALQGLMMLWLGYKLESRFIRSCAGILYVLAMVRLAGCDLSAYSHLPSDGAFWTAAVARCLQFLIPTVCLALGAKLISAYRPPQTTAQTSADAIGGQPPAIRLTAGIFLTIAFLLGFLFLRLELGADLRHALPAFRLAGINLVWLLAIFMALKLLRLRTPGFWWPLFLTLAGIALIRLFVDFCLPTPWNCCHPDFMWSYSLGTIANTLLLAIGLWQIARLLPDDRGELGRQIALVCNIIWPLLLFAHSTRELQTIIDHRLPGLEGGGISILWSIFAFALVFNGLRKSRKVLRLIGLGLFTIVILKVFMLDMRRLDAIYRVGAFLVFGVLLMGAAFIYLKFWRGKEGT